MSCSRIENPNTYTRNIHVQTYIHGAGTFDIARPSSGQLGTSLPNGSGSVQHAATPPVLLPWAPTYVSSARPPGYYMGRPPPAGVRCRARLPHIHLHQVGIARVWCTVEPDHTHTHTLHCAGTPRKHDFLHTSPTFRGSTPHFKFNQGHTHIHTGAHTQTDPVHLLSQVAGTGRDGIVCQFPRNGARTFLS